MSCTQTKAVMPNSSCGFGMMSHSPAVGMVKSRKEMQGFGGGNSHNYAELREM